MKIMLGSQIRAVGDCGEGDDRPTSIGVVTKIDGDYVYADFNGETWSLRQENCREVLADERADVLARFVHELTKATGDGSRKRASGSKPPWYQDDAHEAAIFSHLMKWKRGELIDPDSGAHPLVHLAWRALAIALRETGNVPDARGPVKDSPHS